ncbi:MAG: hypothetical protein IJ769_01915 [Clostridia bacterium]|nr:hypothetical protein [Clostridia bacterium]
MYYETMPLYPALRPGCDSESCVRVPIFDGDDMPCGQPPQLRSCRRVTIENPCRPGECAEVLLGLDACGNLVVCVRREPERDACCRPCRPQRPNRPCLPPEPRGRGRLYGTWR